MITFYLHEMKHLTTNRDYVSINVSLSMYEFQSIFSIIMRLSKNIHFFLSFFLYLYNACLVTYLLKNSSLEQPYLFNKWILILVLILFPQKHFLSRTAGGSITSRIISRVSPMESLTWFTRGSNLVYLQYGIKKAWILNPMCVKMRYRRKKIHAAYYTFPCLSVSVKLKWNTFFFSSSSFWPL